MMSGQPSFLVCRASRRLFSAKNSVDLLAAAWGVACKAEDAGRLSPVKDNNAADGDSVRPASVCALVN